MTNALQESDDDPTHADDVADYDRRHARRRLAGDEVAEVVLEGDRHG
jgi:hypothetical protein